MIGTKLDGVNTMESVSIITVNYNGYSVTCDLLDSLLEYGYDSCEIIVVDNGSIINEAEPLQVKYPGIITIRSEVNLGFAGGNNLGIMRSLRENLLFLNNDMTVTPNFLEPLVVRLNSNSSIGMVSPKILFEYAPDTIQFAGYTPLRNITLRNRLIGYNEVDYGQYDIAAETPYALGAAMLVKRNIIEKVGLIPETYFLYYEELDWCLRIRENGFSIWYEPASKVFHKESATAGRIGPLKQYYITRNRLLFAKRNLKGIVLMQSVVFQLFLSLPKKSFSFLLQNRLDLFVATWKGMCHGIKMIL